ncbi:hypothetical protein HYX07_02745 [Candidatus Woesearchaeota archaeon]|nr:hypothetical protein [Candidatus Woesearchaeota archaeon]
MNEVSNPRAINNQDIRRAMEVANKSGIAYIGDYNLGKCIAVPESHKRGGVYLFPGKGNEFFDGIDPSKLDSIIQAIDAKPGTLRVLIAERRIYLKG